MSDQELFQLISSIGSGSFGEIYLARNLETGEEVAAKVEKIRNRAVKSQLRREAKIYKFLYGQVGIPKVRWFGEYTDKYVLVMDLLGQSLEDLFNYCHRRFTLKTVLLLAYEMVSRIETVHTQGKLIHRDIKPENFLIGRNRDRHTVYMIDFGLAKHYANPRTGRHIPCKEGNSLTGTARYASINSHQGTEQSRRDDLISIGYVLLYFLRGSLPWQGLKTRAQLREEAQAEAQDALAQGQGQGQGEGPTHAPAGQVPVVDSNADLPLPVPASPALVLHSEPPQPLLPATGVTDGGNGDPAGPLGGEGPMQTPVKRAANKVRRETEEQEKYRLIMEKKQATSVESLCAGYPEEFVRYFEHLSTLAFADTPDYAYLKALFRDLFRKLGYKYESILYDWEIIAHQEHQQQLQQHHQHQQVPGPKAPGNQHQRVPQAGAGRGRPR